MLNLQTLSFRLYSENPSPATTFAIEPYVQRFFDAMLAGHPGFQIVSSQVVCGTVGCGDQHLARAKHMSGL